MSRGLSINVKRSLEKAIDSSLLAVETYNKPAIKFKSGGYIVLMTIAWTALFHAYFFKKRIKPFYKKVGSNNYLKIDGEFRYWELNTCIENHYGSDTQNPVRKNLEFFIRLRNQIEHKSMPEIDANIFGECQAMLFNFDIFIEKEFGEKYCIRESLSFALQMFPSKESLSKAIKTNAVVNDILSFIENYRSSISTEVWESGNYAFKAFLIQVANNPGGETLPVQFIHWDKLTDEEKIKTKKIVAMIKPKKTVSSIINYDLYKPKEVVQRVHELLGKKTIRKGGKVLDFFNMDTHTRAWKKYKIRPSGKVATYEKPNEKYCIYDKAHDDYLYTEEWIIFLKDKLSNEDEYNSLYYSEAIIL